MEKRVSVSTVMTAEIHQQKQRHKLVTKQPCCTTDRWVIVLKLVIVLFCTAVLLWQTKVRITCTTIFNFYKF
jgi:hypothetical protein